MLKKDRVRGCVTAGVALVGAGAMAISPVAPQAPKVLEARDAQVDSADTAAPSADDKPD